MKLLLLLYYVVVPCVEKEVVFCMKKDADDVVVGVVWIKKIARQSILASGEVAVVKWLREETRVLTDVDSNPSTLYWMDKFSHTYLL